MLVNNSAIIGILNKEVREVDYSKPAPLELLWNSTNDARQQIKALKNMFKNRHTALKHRYENLRHKKIELERPLKRAQIDAAVEKY
jgi:hypothetical protein